MCVLHAERDIRDIDVALSGRDCRHAQQVSGHFPHHLLDQLLECCDDFVFQRDNARMHIAHKVMNHIHTELIEVIHYLLDQLLECCDDFVFQQDHARTHIAHNVVMR